jgi:hypothetical protein
MADPLSIAASLATVIATCKGIGSYLAKFTLGLGTVPEDLQEFDGRISTLKGALYNVEAVFKDRPKRLPFAKKEESRHWQDIKSVAVACDRSLVRLRNELPRLRADSDGRLDRIRGQLMLMLNSDAITEIRLRLAEYTRTLQLSLTTLSL